MNAYSWVLCSRSVLKVLGREMKNSARVCEWVSCGVSFTAIIIRWVSLWRTKWGQEVFSTIISNLRIIAEYQDLSIVNWRGKKKEKKQQAWWKTKQCRGIFFFTEESSNILSVDMHTMHSGEYQRNVIIHLTYRI